MLTGYNTAGIWISVAASDAPYQQRASSKYVCDGTSDEVQIQAAIDELSVSGGRVVLSEGTFNLSTGLSMVSSCELRGSGATTILRLANASNVNVINASSLSKVTVKNLSIDVNGANQTSAGRGIRAVSCTDIVFTDLWIYNHRLGGINVAQEGINSSLIIDRINISSGSTDIGGNDGMLLNIIRGSVSNCVITGCNDTGVAISGNNQNVVGATPSDITLSNIIVDDCSDGIAIANDTSRVSGTNITITNMTNRIGASGFGLSVYKTALGTNVPDRISFSNFHIFNCEDSGIYLADAASDLSFSNFTIKECGFGIEFKNDSSAYRRIRIANGEISNNDNHGIYMIGVDFAIISNCTIRNSNQSAAGGSGVRGVDSDNVIVTGSHIYDDQGSPTQQYGCYATGTSANWNVQGNQFSGNTSGAVSAPGIVRNNTGYVTEKSGTATLANGTTSIAVTHGLSKTPVAGNIVVTPMETWGSMTKFYIDTYTSTQFTIRADANPGVDVDFAWSADIT